MRDKGEKVRELFRDWGVDHATIEMEGAEEKSVSTRSNTKVENLLVVKNVVSQPLFKYRNAGGYVTT